MLKTMKRAVPSLLYYLRVYSEGGDVLAVARYNEICYLVSPSSTSQLKLHN